MPQVRYDLLESAEGEALLSALRSQEDDLFKAARERDHAGVERMLRSLAEPINRFFDGTMVMVEDANVRYARLTLLHACSLQLLAAGDFSKIVVEG